MTSFLDPNARAELPEELRPLLALALNLRWSWDQRTQQLFRRVDPEVWEESDHDPLRLLASVGASRLEALCREPAFMELMAEVHSNLQHYLEGSPSNPGTYDGMPSVAYFSPEFGITESIPQYSGGLGVLAGDHLKAASGLALPLVGVGLLYQRGYFRQTINLVGWQTEFYPTLDPRSMPLRLARDARVEVSLAGTPLAARIWRADIGRVPLYLLDANVEENDEWGRQVTDTLYGGDVEQRLRQEILLGVGGVRALAAVGEAPELFHSNEGHAGFMGLERIRRLLVDEGCTFEQAVEQVRAHTVFTTHTPVAAGIDRFPRHLMERYFSGWAEECGIDFERLMALGQEPGESPEAPFNMAYVSLRLAASSNGVSQLHGSVSRRMFAHLWPGISLEEVPIGSVTNGVHGPSWVFPEMARVLARYVAPDWPMATRERWAGVE
ncbi:MAG: alpha-glucan family phosphorylase, partial [Candidatus Methylomirabilales bacterium]